MSCVVFVRSRVFRRGFSERVGVLDTTGSKKSFRERERERKSAKERAHRKKDRQTQTTERRRKTRNRILGREDDIVRDDDDSDDERISSSTPGKISQKKKKRWSARNVRMMAAPGTDGKTPYVAKNTFTIPRDESGVKLEEIKRRFLDEMRFREEKMKTMPDYVSSQLTEIGANSVSFRKSGKRKKGSRGG